MWTINFLTIWLRPEVCFLMLFSVRFHSIADTWHDVPEPRPKPGAWICTVEVQPGEVTDFCVSFLKMSVAMHSSSERSLSILELQPVVFESKWRQWFWNGFHVVCSIQNFSSALNAFQVICLIIVLCVIPVPRSWPSGKCLCCVHIQMKINLNVWTLVLFCEQDNWKFTSIKHESNSSQVPASRFEPEAATLKSLNLCLCLRKTRKI